jgi:hypothetical protein
MGLCCKQDDRRDAVRDYQGLTGIDYVEVSADQKTLTVYFLGKLPPELQKPQLGLQKYVRIDGGTRITGIQVVEVTPFPDPDPEEDDYLTVQLDKYGDFSTYTLQLVGVDYVDSRYDHVDFSFKVDCPSDLDCAPVCTCAPPVLDEPVINYLAKDYSSFRQLIFDRLAVLMPNWTERHVPDIGVALVELLAYTGDYLSYYQDAVATEAYLGTARERISVRRHARLVDYFLQEGCNARTWVCVELEKEDLPPLDPKEMLFVTGLNDQLPAKQTVLTLEDLQQIPPTTYEVFEPLVEDGSRPLQFYSAHSEIDFYTWGQKECCLELGSTSATFLDLLDSRVRPLKLQPGDILIFEEKFGPRTGIREDADPTHRHAVRLTKVSPGEDPIILTADGKPTPVVEVEWAQEDKLPFPFCISLIGPPPDCHYLENVSVARGNVVLVDHGQTLDSEELGVVPTEQTDAKCECADHPSDILMIPGVFSPNLAQKPLTYREPYSDHEKSSANWTPASVSLSQMVADAQPQIVLNSQPGGIWEPSYDLIEIEGNDQKFVVEIDNEGFAHLRFGDGELGAKPVAGATFSATYRVGNGKQGNVGRESISRLVLKKTLLSGISMTIRNPLPAQGGTDQEPISEAKLFAPYAFKNQLERAIIAADYSALSQRNKKIQRAATRLEYTGSWYEADVAIDPFGEEDPDAALLSEIEKYLHQYRRMGHDLEVLPAIYVPLDIKIEVCALPDYQAAHVKAALLAVFSNRVLAGGRLGFFHPDNLTFGEGIDLSRIIAAGQQVAGVESVRVTRFQRLFEPPNDEIANGILPLRSNEIAQLDNNQNYPEHGTLEIIVRGGR